MKREDSGLRIQVVRSAAGFRQMRRAWEKLLDCSGTDTYYLTHEWLSLWLEYFYPRSAQILLLWKKGDLACAFPMVRTSFPYHGFRIRKLALTRDWYSPFGAILCAPGADEEIGAVMRYLERGVRRWDILDLDGLVGESQATRAFLRRLRSRGWPFHVEDSFGNWVLEGFGSWDHYWNDRSKRKMRRKSIVYRDRLLELGELRTRIISNDTDVSRLFEQFYQLYQRSWKRNIEQHPDFLKATMSLAATNNALRIAFLDLDGKPIASWYAFLHGSTAYLPRTGYDSRLRRHMPGLVLLEDFLRHLIEVDKVRMVDFQHGDEQYKSSWANVRKIRKRIVVANPGSWKGRLYVRGEYVSKPKLELSLLWRAGRRGRDVLFRVRHPLRRERTRKI